MSFECWRGVVGIIKPTMRPGGLEDMIRMLPEGIGVLGLYNDIRRGTVDEFEKVMADYDANVARLAEQKVDIIHPEGAPPFMVMGLKGEAKKIRAWKKQHGIPVFTSGTNHIRAMKALNIRKFVGATYFPGRINRTFAEYFEEAGFEPLAMEGIDVAFDQVQTLSSHRIYAHVKQSFLQHRKADGIYMLGSGWQCLDVIELLERDLGVPVVHPIPARVWEIQKRLRINEPRQGYGRLLAELPDG